MIIKYLTAIQKLFESMRSGDSTFSFMDFLTTIGLSLTFALTIALMIAFVLFFAVGPFKIYGVTVKSLKTERSNVFADASIDAAKANEMANTISKKIRNRTILFVLGIIFVYLPIAIPSLLYVFYLIFHV